MKRPLCVSLICAIFIAGCAGSDPNPIASYIPGDDKKSCPVLKGEMAQLEAEKERKLAQKGTKDFWNVVFFVTGFLVIVPWFFIDAKNAEKTEAEALQARHNRLGLIAAEKGCMVTGVAPDTAK